MTTTIKVEPETLEAFRNKRIAYLYKNKITKMNDDEYVRYLLGETKNE
jgi:hypothetical protein